MCLAAARPTCPLQAQRSPLAVTGLSTLYFILCVLCLPQEEVLDDGFHSVAHVAHRSCLPVWDLCRHRLGSILVFLGTGLSFVQAVWDTF